MLSYRRQSSFAPILIIGASVIYLTVLYFSSRCTETSDSNERPLPLPPFDHSAADMSLVDKNSPFIFIGGVPRSGTTLMRAMLDAHPLVRCGEETTVIPAILAMRAKARGNAREAQRLDEAGVTEDVFNGAISSFIIEVIARHGEPAHRLCIKDPFTLKSAQYLSKIFPNSKFVLMIRDGRAAVHSMISRKVTIQGFDLKNPRQCLEMWNEAIENMYNQCSSVGPERCFMMRYEELVLYPEAKMRQLLTFLDIPWNSTVLRHETFIGEGKEIPLSDVEMSIEQVVKPINLDALNKWVGQFPADVVRDMAEIAPMLRRLGYDPRAEPPKYGKLDELVVRKMKEINENEIKWHDRANMLMVDPLRLDRPFNEIGNALW